LIDDGIDFVKYVRSLGLDRRRAEKVSINF